MAYTGPFPHTNAGTTSAIVVSGTSFTGGVGNTGKILVGDPTGIRVEHNSTISGAISNAGAITVAGNGIVVAGTTSSHDDSVVTSGIINAGAGTIASASGGGIVVEYETRFSGGISNAGSISVEATGILVNTVFSFAGGIANSGKINALDSGVLVEEVSNFTGGVTNKGTISAASNSGIDVYKVGTFAGGVSNVGTIDAGAAGIDIDQDFDIRGRRHQ